MLAFGRRGNYRELLATAEAIVILDEKTRATGDHLSSIGHDCRPPELDASPRAPPADKVALAQLRLLQRCCTTSSLSLRNQDLLQCAQLMVVSRLLLNSLIDQEAISKSLDFLRDQISRLRRKLLRQVDAKLASPVSNVRDLLAAICSYCLVTSASSEDALGHLRHLRLEKIRHQLRISQLRSTICEALRYQLASLQTFKSLIGRPMVEAMNDLQKRPILQNPAIRELDSLDLDRVMPLIPNDIRSFVPYFKRSAPTAGEMQIKFEAWSREACRALSDSLSSHLSALDNLAAVLELRKDLLMILLPSYFSTPAGSELNHEVSKALNDKVAALCLGEGMRLDRISNLLVEGNGLKVSTKSLWDPEIAQSSLGHGGAKVIKQVTKRHAGHSGALSKSTKALHSWILSANLTQSLIEELTKIRWRDVLEEPEEENEEDASTLITTICETEPRSYMSSLQESLQVAIRDFEAKIADAAAQVADDPSSVHRAVELLRSIRASIASLKQAFQEEANFGRLAGIIPKLHHVVANEVSRQLAKSMEEGKRSRKWDKTILPENMPSPRAFLTLRRLCEIMMEIGGTDLWSPAVVELVKKAVSERVFKFEFKSRYLQHEFDEAYLCHALNHTMAGSVSGSSEANETVRSAAEYWARTRLLFGLLA